MPIDFAPHDLTGWLSHPPYRATSSSGYGSSGFGGTQGSWRTMDGNTSTYWTGTGGGVDWLTLDIDSYVDAAPHDLTSATSHSPMVVTVSTEYSGYEAFYTLNNTQTNAWWIGTNNGTEWIKYDFGAGNAFILDNYEIETAPPDWGAGRQPKSWTIQGSNDDSSWTTVHTVTNHTWPDLDSRAISWFRCTDRSTAYRYYKIDITANIGGGAATEISEVYLYAPRVSTPTKKVLQNYSILYAYTFGGANRAPKNWTMEGSNDQVTWDVIDTVTNETGWGNPETRNYVCDVTTTAYEFFKLNITANNGDATYTEIHELYLYEESAPVELAGTSAGTSTASAGLSIDRSLAGVSAGTSTSTAALYVEKGLAGVSAGTSGATADLTVESPVMNRNDATLLVILWLPR